MEKIKKNKVIYIGICIVIVIICIVICYFIDKNNNDKDYSYLEVTEEKNNVNVINKVSEVEEETAKIIYIHIAGEVVNPGVIAVKEGDRIKDVIEAAGGVTDLADISKVNLAYQVSDGQKINIPNINYEQEDDEQEKNENYITDASGENIVVEGEESSNKSSKVNINTATQTELETLSGIGPSTASKIIAYREQNGKFKNIEEIKNVSGIGEAKYKNIENDITVK